MRIDDETLMAYADGELSPLEAKRIEAAMAEDFSLAARVQRFRAVRRALKTAYDAVAAEPVPEHLRALLGDVAATEPAARSAPAKAQESRRPPCLGVIVGLAIAVSLLAGFLLGRALG